MYYENMMGMHAIWWVFWVGLVVTLLFWRGGRGRGGGGDGSAAPRNKPRDTPNEALRRRLASGEVSAEEYEKRKALLDRDS